MHFVNTHTNSVCRGYLEQIYVLFDICHLLANEYYPLFTVSSESAQESSTGNDSKQGSTSSTSSERERAQSPPFRSHSMSRSPTPTSPHGPLKIKKDPEIPEWKRKLMEKKKTGASPAIKRATPTTTNTAKKEPELPAWKKELLARKQGKTSPERKVCLCVCV